MSRDEKCSCCKWLEKNDQLFEQAKQAGFIGECRFCTPTNVMQVWAGGQIAAPGGGKQIQAMIAVWPLVKAAFWCRNFEMNHAALKKKITESISPENNQN